jgi:DnaJ-class molecular chaperone
VSVDASACDIKRAYNDALAIYNDDALVTYSLFSEEQRADILNNIEIAFETLIDNNKRIKYNRRLLKSGKMVTASTFEKSGEQVDFLSDALNKTKTDGLRSWVKMKSADGKVSALVDAVLSKDVITGKDLKKLRCTFGIELSEIYEITRISGSMIKNIEGDQFNALPAEIYLKQFLRSYAEILQINAQAIISGYLKNMPGNNMSM